MKKHFPLIFLIVLFLIVFSGTGYNQQKYNVVYEVTGTAEVVFITVSTPGGGTAQFDESAFVFLHWRKSYDFDKGSFLYVSAQNRGRPGTVIVKIYVNDNKVRESASEGAGVIAHCSGRL